MTTETLVFNGTAIGDFVLRTTPGTAAESRPVVQTGIWQSRGRTTSDTINLAYRMRFSVYIKRTTNLDCALAIQTIQERANERGLLILRRDGVAVMQWLDCILEDIQQPDLDPQYAGRFTDRLEIGFVGASFAPEAV